MALEGGQQPRALPEGRVVRQRQAPPRLRSGRTLPEPAGGVESAGRWKEALTAGPGPRPAACSPRGLTPKPCDCNLLRRDSVSVPVSCSVWGLRLSFHLQVPSLLSTETESDAPVRPQRSAHGVAHTKDPINVAQGTNCSCFDSFQVSQSLSQNSCISLFCRLPTQLTPPTSVLSGFSISLSEPPLFPILFKFSTILSPHPSPWETLDVQLT